MSTLSSCQQSCYEHQKWTVVNGTFTGDLNERMPRLEALKLFCDFEYNPQKLNAAIVRRLSNNNGTILLFESGKFVMIGIKNLEEATQLGTCLVGTLHGIGLDCHLSDVSCKNLVVKTLLGDNFVRNLWSILDTGPVTTLHSACKKQDIRFVFEPELFPSIKFYTKNPKSCVCIFRKGTCIITGITDLSGVNCIIACVESLLNNGNV
jgi:TATA-box binding protein (TBP) (component of TFIID and TFIIIB)